MEEIQFKSDCQEVNDEDDYSDMTLRPLDPAADIDDFMVWATDEKVTKYCSWEPFTSKEDAMKHIINNVVPHPWYRTICLKNRAIGAVSVTKNCGHNSCRGELGYALAAKYWGKGIMTRAVKMAAGDIFMEWPHLKRLEAVVEVNNKGSLRVLEKAGFEREGVLRKYCLLKGEPVDMVMFSILSPDFPI